jgi:predicted nucleic acid-binding protein
MSALVVDTDVVSFLFKRDSRAVLYRPHLLGQTLHVSFMTVAELERWGRVSNWGVAKTARLDRYLRRFRMLLVDRPFCRKWAEVVEMARHAGLPIGLADAWIAATALAFGAPPITHNPSDYAGVPALTVIAEAP